MSSRWTDADREAAYTRLCEAITAAGRDRETQFLARVALLLAEEVSDMAAVQRAIEAAAQSLTPAIPA